MSGGSSGGEQGGRRPTVEIRFASIGQVVEDIALLYPQRRHDRQDALDKSAAVGAIGSKAGLSLHHRVANALFSLVIRRLNTFNIDEGPERRLEFQYLATSTCNGAQRAARALT